MSDEEHVVAAPAAWAPGQPLCNPQHLRPWSETAEVGAAWRAFHNHVIACRRDCRYGRDCAEVVPLKEALQKARESAGITTRSEMRPDAAPNL